MKIAINRVEPIILEFENGSTKTLMLNNSALMILTEEFGDINELFKNSTDKPIELLSKLIYAGIKATEPNFTYEEAEIIAVNGGFNLLVELTEHLSQVLNGYCKDESLKKNILQKAQEQIKKIKK
ncbi:hypothetical protein HMPREF9628_00136 [Peptoanaerobacter stomatis]|uniref:Uncharacterized protein n=1 Tax=Peptoanaerobacter stomatis TaxID=796937 RepID=G9XA45_9FIRM|nr:hypothetical protein [Peptoanaerobacter stomatis]EHL20291.1 hypothetical protein HMPREF9628_00136 [Peptoanaerobacter stomatis]